MFLSTKSFGCCALAFASLSVSASAASIFSTGFEPPTYSLGNLSGQDGWSIFNPADSFDTVQNVNVKSGTQAAFVGTNQVGTAQTGMFHTDTLSGSPLIDFNADLYIYSSSTESEWQFAGINPGQFIGGVDLFPTVGPTDTIAAITAGFPSIGSLTLNSWNNFDFLYNFSTQTYSIRLNGSLLAANVPFCGDAGPCAGAPIAEAQFQSFFDVFASITSNDLGAVDNWSISSVAIPEPATFGLTGIVMLAGALALRRRK
jgi:hypothetical protein